MVDIERGALDAFDDSRNRTAIVIELLRAVLDCDPSALADVLVVGTFIRVLETSPAANVVNEDHGVVG